MLDLKSKIPHSAFATATPFIEETEVSAPLDLHQEYPNTQDF